MKDVNNTETLKSEKKLLSSEQAKYFYNLREKSKRDWISALANARDRRTEEITVELIKMNIPIDVVKKSTGLSGNDILKLESKFLI